MTYMNVRAKTLAVNHSGAAQHAHTGVFSLQLEV